MQCTADGKGPIVRRTLSDRSPEFRTGPDFDRKSIAAGILVRINRVNLTTIGASSDGANASVWPPGETAAVGAIATIVTKVGASRCWALVFWELRLFASFSISNR
jgi:hypothetical protein